MKLLTFDTRSKQWRLLITRVVNTGFLVLGALVAVVLFFQIFLRYQYLETQGTLWRIDRLTQQMCQVNIGYARCRATSHSTSISPTVSTSTSTALSTSTSTSLRLRVSRRPPKGSHPPH